MIFVLIVLVLIILALIILALIILALIIIMVFVLMVFRFWRFLSPYHTNSFPGHSLLRNFRLRRPQTAVSKVAGGLGLISLNRCLIDFVWLILFFVWLVLFDWFCLIDFVWWFCLIDFVWLTLLSVVLTVVLTVVLID